MVVCVLSPSWFQLVGWPPPLPHSYEGSAPILVNHPSMTWADKMPISLSPSLPLLVRVSSLSRMFPTPQSLSRFPFSSLLPLSFLEEYLSKTGLIFALISNLKRLLTPKSLAFSSSFLWSADRNMS